jgi:hypothetical protein
MPPPLYDIFEYPSRTLYKPLHSLQAFLTRYKTPPPTTSLPYSLQDPFHPLQASFDPLHPLADHYTPPTYYKPLSYPLQDPPTYYKPSSTLYTPYGRVTLHNIADISKQIDNGQKKWRQGVDLTSIENVNDYIKFKILKYEYFKFINNDL